MNPTGWSIVPVGLGFALFHSSGYYIAGFDTKADASQWLYVFLMGQQEQLRKAETRRERILAEMPVHGKVAS